MKRIITALLIISIFLTACVPSVAVSDFPSKSKYYAKVTQNCSGQIVNIITKSGITFSGTDLIVKVDSTSWLDGETKILTRKIPTNRVLEIKRNEHGAGAVQGLFFGLAGGTVAGVLIGSTVENTNDFNPKILFGAVFGIVSGILGLVYGIANGAPIVYKL
ncbi:MAG: hypothetical protein KKA84_02930 [Bacteroidetes bacterium]|nr:hypothetical protein [Bacteroidota bacterium]